MYVEFVSYSNNKYVNDVLKCYKQYNKLKHIINDPFYLNKKYAFRLLNLFGPPSIKSIYHNL